MQKKRQISTARAAQAPTRYVTVSWIKKKFYALKEKNGA